MKRTLLLIIILTGLSSENPSFAQALTLQDEISAYNKGDYRQTIYIGQQLTSKNLYDANSHYYMAIAYTRLGQVKEAVEEYSFCDKITDNPQLKAYCDQGLHLLLSNQSNSANNSYLNIAYAMKNTQTVQTNQNRQARQAMQEQIRDIRESARAAERSIPRFTYNDNNQRINNPDYRIDIENIRAEERERVTSIREDVNTSPDQLIQSYDQGPNGPNPVIPQSMLAQYPYSEPTFSYIPKLSLTTKQYNPSPSLLSPYIASSNIPGQYSSIPNYNQPHPLQEYSYLFDHSPLPPPPFPSSAIKEAEKSLHEKIH